MKTLTADAILIPQHVSASTGLLNVAQYRVTGTDEFAVEEGEFGYGETLKEAVAEFEYYTSAKCSIRNIDFSGDRKHCNTTGINHTQEISR